MSAAQANGAAPIMDRFNALPEMIRKMVSRDYTPDATDPDGYLTANMRALRHNGFTVTEAIDLAGYFPKGIGLLAGKAGKKLLEIWGQIEAADAIRNQQAATADRMLRQTAADTLLARQFPPAVSLLGSLVQPASRMFVVGPTGTGKTMLLMAMAGGMITGRGFLGWHAERESRVLFVDGEMPLHLLRARMELLTDQLQVYDLPNFHYVSWQEPVAIEGAQWGPLNTPEGQSYLEKLCDIIRPDVVFLDNVQCLLSGDMREETPWNETQPLVLELTRRGIAQVWGDHTGHDQSRQYGSSRKAFSFDTVLLVRPLPRDDADLAFAINFDAKSRNRTPDNRDEYRARTMTLRDNEWSWIEDDGAASAGPPKKRGRPPVGAKIAWDTLQAAFKQHGRLKPVPPNGVEVLTVTDDEWREAFERTGGQDNSKPKSVRRAFYRGKQDLAAGEQIGHDRGLVWLTGKPL